MYLRGAEDVARAGAAISSAAESFALSVRWLEEALQRENERRNEHAAMLIALAERLEKLPAELERVLDTDRMRRKSSL